MDESTRLTDSDCKYLAALTGLDGRASTRELRKRVDGLGRWVRSPPDAELYILNGIKLVLCIEFVGHCIPRGSVFPVTVLLPRT
jgi:hypothetical protein